MQIMRQTKGVKITIDNWFDAFRGMERGGFNKIELPVKSGLSVIGYIFTLSNPVENVWFVHAFTLDGVDVGAAKFDEFDL